MLEKKIMINNQVHGRKIYAKDALHWINEQEWNGFQSGRSFWNNNYIYIRCIWGSHEYTQIFTCIGNGNVYNHHRIQQYTMDCAKKKNKTTIVYAINRPRNEDMEHTDFDQFERRTEEKKYTKRKHNSSSDTNITCVFFSLSFMNTRNSFFCSIYYFEVLFSIWLGYNHHFIAV